MIRYVIIVAVLVILIVLLCRYVDGDWRRRRQYRALTNKSSGVFDKAARDALIAINGISKPTANDRFARANIHRYNILQDDIERANRDEIRTIATDYTAAIRQLREDGLGDETRGNDRPERILFGVQNFAERLNQFDFGQIDDDTLFFNAIMAFGNTVDEAAPVVHQNIVQARRDAAATVSENREDLADNYLKSAVKYTSDPQNVHDSTVNKDLRATLAKLQNYSLGGTSDESIKEAREFIIGEYADNPLNTNKVQRALQVLDNIAVGNPIGTFETTEDRIFHVTWQRTKHRDNAGKRKLMQEAVADSLADAVEGETPVCINGRCGRVLNSLATLDSDKSIGQVNTLETYRNQIFTEAREIVRSEIERAKSSPIDMIKQVGRSYEDPMIKTDPTAEEEFRSTVREELDECVEGYRDKFSPNELEQIKQECYAAI